MEMVRKIQKSFYAQDNTEGTSTLQNDNNMDDATEEQQGKQRRTTTTPVASTNTILQNVPLWRVQWVELPGYQNLLNVHVAHYTHMFHSILAGPKPWYFGHVYLKDGSENLDNPDYHFIPQWKNQTNINNSSANTNSNTETNNSNNKATYTGVLMQVADYKQLEDGRLAMVVQALERFEVMEAKQHEPYAVATVQLIPDAELAMPFYETAQQQARDLSDDFLNDEDAWGAACAAALQTAEELREFECKPVLVESSSMGAVAPLINYDTELEDLANLFPSDATAVDSRKETIRTIMEEHLFSASPMSIPENVGKFTEEKVVQLEYDVWVGVDALINLLHQLSSNPNEARVTPVPTQMLGLLPRRGSCFQDGNGASKASIPWPDDFKLDQYATRLEDYAATMSVGTFSKSPFVRYDYADNDVTTYPIMRRAQRLSFVVWILLESIGIVGEDDRGGVSRPISKQEILEFPSITERLEAAKGRLDAINDALRLLVKEG